MRLEALCTGTASAEHAHRSFYVSLRRGHLFYLFWIAMPMWLIYFVSPATEGTERDRAALRRRRKPVAYYFQLLTESMASRSHRRPSRAIDRESDNRGAS